MTPGFDLSHRIASHRIDQQESTLPVFFPYLAVETGSSGNFAFES